MRVRLIAPKPTMASRSTSLIRTARPYAVSISSDSLDMPMIAWVTPVASTSAIAPTARVE
jgi:hypothetical protein